MTDDPRLINARNAHREKTNHNNIMIGLNFIECLECHAHAHLSGTKDNFIILHDSHYENVKNINPDEF